MGEASHVVGGFKLVVGEASHVVVAVSNCQLRNINYLHSDSDSDSDSDSAVTTSTLLEHNPQIPGQSHGTRIAPRDAPVVRGLFLVVLRACGARSELYVTEPPDEAGTVDVHTPRDAGRDVEGDASDGGVVFTPTAFCNPSDAGPPATVCTAALTVETIITQGGCTNFYVPSDNEMGTLEFACDTDASTWAEATFEAGTFQGSINGTFADVCIGTTYEYNSGPSCGFAMSLWSTAQTIYGDITSGMLTFAYREAQVSGNSCAIPCTAIATVLVH